MRLGGSLDLLRGRLGGGREGRRRRNLDREGDGELIGDDVGHGEVGRGYGWTQRRVAVWVEVVDVTGVSWLAGDEVSRRRSFGRRRFQPFPAATERGNKGERIRGLQGFQIEAEEERGRPIPRKLW